jgi:hypothetical protein
MRRDRVLAPDRNLQRVDRFVDATVPEIEPSEQQVRFAFIGAR